MSYISICTWCADYYYKTVSGVPLKRPAWFFDVTQAGEGLSDVGTHLIDLWPQYYSHQPSFANTQYGMVPLLSGGWDNGALALGYTVPVLHFAIKVVK